MLKSNGYKLEIKCETTGGEELEITRDVIPRV